MSLAARCPQCTTLFRISAEQLSAAAGWARCGVCGQAFEASTRLLTPDGEPVSLPDLLAPQGDEPSTPSQAAQSEMASPFQAMPDIDLELPDLGALDAPDERPVNPAVPAVEPTDQVAAASAPAPVVQLPTQPEPPPVEPEPAVPPASQTAHVHEALADVSAVAPRDLRGDFSSGSFDSVPSTGPAPAPSAPAPAVNAGAGAMLLAAALLVTLGGMGVFVARGHIAQAWPEARPLIVQACQAIGCQMPTLRSLQGLALEADSLSLDADDGLHRLRVTLRNSTDTPLVVPALELTLLDSDAQVLARRALLPDELSLPQGTVSAQGSLDLLVKLDLKALDSSAIASFRLSPFHP